LVSFIFVVLTLHSNTVEPIRFLSSVEFYRECSTLAMLVFGCEKTNTKIETLDMKYPDLACFLVGIAVVWQYALQIGRLW
jgi:hypothetical protein